MSYVDMAQMPIVIATSSIALQKAILTEYIPALSQILMNYGIIRMPITAVLRKGREHYVCERNLRSCLSFEQNSGTKQALKKLLAPKAPIDIAEIEGLDRFTKGKIAVPDKCTYGCPHRDTCSYLRFREHAASPDIDIQVLNHNYFLADLKLREKGDKRVLIPNYQTVIIDEAHKFLSAARTMFGSELSSVTLPDIKDTIFSLTFKSESAQKLARKTAKKLSDESKRLFKGLEELSRDEQTDDEATRFTAVIDGDGHRHLRNLRNIADTLYELLASESVSTNGEGKKSDLLWELASAREQLASLARHDDHICWLEHPDLNITPGIEQEIRLCAIPKDLDARLLADLWNRGIPTILTSGTLSAGGDFSHIKRMLGLEKLGHRLTETSKPSPFNYRENALLYISESVPFPDQSNRAYIAAVADETEKLIRASHGHAAVLFTSYKAMDMVWEQLMKRGLPFPLHRLDKGGVREIEKFKQSGNGVLFASGALWEGIDIPGDTLSMLIIVKLPFQVPDPIGEYEQTLYRDMFEYKSKLVVPEMLIKLKQGFGRLIRTERDTGCVAILDSRAASGGAYRERVLTALPDCRLTADIAEVTGFMDEKKPPEYFNIA
jgi:ATP-dependent DNA helicase DinG